MKNTFLLLISILAINLTGFGQVKPIQKAVINTPGVQDEACKTRIENYIAHEYGIIAVKADYKKHVVGVQWYSDRTNIENIKTAIANLGYDADDVTADPDAYKRLPKTCQHISK
ncbi:MAG: heavy-metal-associated domain-containing protein [Bacteroidetes bacterium]|nr:heavy-metal-associated domain-containing protein [Bacteroidota bacterium]